MTKVLANTPKGFEASRYPVTRLYSVASSQVQKIGPGDLDGQDVLHYSIPNVQEYGTGAVENGDTIDSDKWTLQNDSVLLSKLNPRKATVCLATPSSSLLTVASTEFIPFATGSKIDNRFLNYLLQTPIVTAHLTARTESATRSHQRVNPRLVTSMVIPWPDAPSRQQVVDYLDRETAEIDAFIADLDDYSALLSHRLNAERDLVFLSLAKYSDPVPLKRWLEIPLNYGATESADHFDPSEIRYLRITDFGTDGNLRPETATSLPHEAAAGYMTAPGDILLARSGATVGKAFMVPDSLPEACFAGYLVRARFQNRAEAGFVWHALQTTSYRAWISANATVATIQNVSAQKFGIYPIPRPSQAVQSEVIEELDRTQKNIDGAQALAAEAKTLAKERRAALISAAVSGQIDVSARGVSAAEQLRDELAVHV